MSGVISRLGPADAICPGLPLLEVVTPMGVLRAQYSGDPGFYDGIEVSLLTDRGELQVVCAEVDATGPVPVLGVRSWDGVSEGPTHASILEVSPGSCWYVAPERESPGL